MKKTRFSSISFSLLCLFFLFSIDLHAQTSQWVWESGSTLTNSNGNEYTDIANVPSEVNFPAARENGSMSADKAGNLWVFGGGTISTDFGKLWKYNIQTNEWTWITGPTADAVPPARRGAVSWIDNAGNFWLFSGAQNQAGLFPVNDFWKFDVAINKWIKIPLNGMYSSGIYGTKGIASPENRPGARFGSASWKDEEGNLWLFGGHGYAVGTSTRDIGSLNDVWKYDVSANEWTWMGGTQGTWGYTGGGGSYGTKGVSSLNNIPSSREYATAQTDGKGTVWLFGSDNNLNDLWKYDIATNEWTWMTGDTIINNNESKGHYGNKGVAVADNLPGYRNGMCSFIDSSGNFWIFGGSFFKLDGSSSTYVGGYLNDLWMFDIKENEWVWIDGDSTVNTTRMYGTRTIPALTNNPGGRSSMASATDNKGRFWMFGGLYVASDGLPQFLNDLWTYTPSQILPLTLVSFTGTVTNQSATLNWMVAQAVNNQGFEIQKSKDGRTFSDLNYIASHSSNAYTFTDPNVFSGSTFYRLKMIDLNGSFTYSPVVNLTYSSFNWHVINTTAQNASVSLQLDKPSSLTVQVIALNGSIIQSIQKGRLEAGGYLIPLNIYNASPGLYTIRLMVNEKLYFRKTIISH